MKIWFTADMLFGDDAVIQERERPFDSWTQMNEAIMDRWNILVRPADTVWILGGAVTFTDWWRSQVPWLSRLNGRKYLLAGPHDRCLARYEGFKASAQEYLEYRKHNGVIQVVTGAEYVKRRGNNKPVPIQIPLMGGEGHGYPNVVLSAFHTPYDSLRDDPFAVYRPRWRDRRDGQARYFVHGYAPWVVRDLEGREPGRELNVGMDAWDFEPVPADLVASLLVDQ
jgi:calcineurin-like phosphoesterase family protein